MWKSGIINLKKEILEQSGEKFACDIITQGQWAAASPFLCFNALNGNGFRIYPSLRSSGAGC